MTAEIVVMNRQAIALAADSAVTVSTQKTLVSANKLFTLSKYHPVGLMIYGNASFMDLPWETLVKDYRRHLGKKSYPTLNEYAAGFVRYLHDLTVPRADEAEERHVYEVVYSFFRSLARLIFLEWRAASGTSADAREALRKTAIRVLARERREWQAEAPLADAPADYADAVLAKHRSTIRRALKDALQEVPLSASVRRRLLEFAASLFGKNRFVGDVSSGLVVAGFGEDELVPSVVAHQVQGLVLSVLKCQQSLHTTCLDTRETIIPFAQQEMVHTFMRGIDPDQQAALERHLSTLFSLYPEYVVSDVGAILHLDEAQRRRLRARIRKQSHDLFEDWQRRAEEYRTKNHVDPVLTMVGALGKNELATMAETLVNLTSFKRRVTLDTETVGGAIDVAVISKGDGMVWVKRKHYFPAELNHHFFANYHMEDEDA